MATEVMVAIIAAFASVFVASGSYFFTRRLQREAEWRDAKLNHYKVLLSSISDLAINGQDDEVHRIFALAMNTIAIVAPQKVVEAALAFHDGIKGSNPCSSETHDQLLAQLLLAIRYDIGMKPMDDTSTFRYHLVGAPPRTN